MKPSHPSQSTILPNSLPTDEELAEFHNSLQLNSDSAPGEATVPGSTGVSQSSQDYDLNTSDDTADKFTLQQPTKRK